MTFARSETFRSIGHILAADVLPALYRSQKLPLRISCLGVASYDASDAANSFDRVISLGERPSPEEAIQAGALRLSCGDICTGPDSFPYFQPRVMLHVHQKGVGVCGIFPYEVAETKVNQVMDFARQNQHPLQCTLEKA